MNLLTEITLVLMKKSLEKICMNFYNNYEQITDDNIDNYYTNLISTFTTVLNQHAPIKQSSMEEKLNLKLNLG